MPNTSNSANPIDNENFVEDSQHSTNIINNILIQNTNVQTHPNDIGNFVSAAKLSKDEIKNLLNNIWRPDIKYKFPYPDNNKNNRKFSPKWFDDFPWLSYSALPDKEGAFCRYCVLMGKVTGGRGAITLRNFIKEPFTRYRKGIESFTGHQNCEYHIMASQQVNELLSNDVAIDEMLCIQRRTEAAKRQAMENEYRRRLYDMFETTKVLGVQEMSFRGHRDQGALDLDSKPGPIKESNFKAILRYRSLGDKQLYEDIKNAPKNSQLTSGIIQNQMILICGEVIKESFLNDIKKAGIYSIIADCTADVSKNEQLAYAVRYVTEDGDMREDMIGLMNPEATTGVALAGDITNGLTNFGLSLEDARGQAYDGCGNMSGYINGAQAIIKEMNPLAIYTHCQSHKLNLALASALAVTGVKAMLSIVSQVSDFVSGSPARVSLLEKNVEECFPGSRKKKVKPLCRVEQHESIITFHILLKPILMTLEDIKEQGNNAAVWKAACFYNIMTV